MIKGTLANGIPQKLSEEIFAELAEFSKYAFNKSHAAAYAKIVYQTAYLKYYYRAVYLVALLKNCFSAKQAEYIEEYKKYGIKILPPDINESGADFMGTALNKKAVESLIKCGAFDSINPNRRQILINSADIVENALRNGRNTALGQFTMFDTAAEQSVCADNFPPEADFSLSDKLLFEKELSGIYFSGHPLDKFRRKFETARCVPISEITEERYKDGQSVRVGVMISKITRKKTSKGTVMATAEIEDFVSSCEAVVFPNILERFQSEFYVGNIAVIDAEVSFDYNDNLNLIVKNVTKPENYIVPGAQKL